MNNEEKTIFKLGSPTTAKKIHAKYSSVREFSFLGVEDAIVNSWLSLLLLREKEERKEKENRTQIRYYDSLFLWLTIIELSDWPAIQSQLYTYYSLQIIWIFYSLFIVVEKKKLGTASRTDATEWWFRKDLLFNSIYIAIRLRDRYSLDNVVIDMAFICLWENQIEVKKTNIYCVFNS